MKEERVKTFLEEGYDFIEESCFGEPLEYTEPDSTVISESVGAKSPFKIIGRLAGKFAPVGGFSRNNRYYPESHWKNVLESAEVQRRLKGREMMGMIGHEDSRVGDHQIREGLVSHVVSKLEIREDNNHKPYLYGEMDILDTPAGRILKAMHEGGAGLYVSSRGAGKLLDTPGKPYKTVAPQFFLECFDVVARPGFLEARPTFEAVSVEPTPQPTIQEKQIKESQETTSKPSLTVSEAQPTPAFIAKENYSIPTVATNEEVEVLKEQIDKLAKVLEKVVDDVYEVDEAEEKQEETKITESAEAKGALIGTLALLANSNVPENIFEEVIEIIKKSKENK